MMRMNEVDVCYSPWPLPLSLSPFPNSTHLSQTSSAKTIQPYSISISSLPKRKSKMPSQPACGPTSPPTWNVAAPPNTPPPSSKRRSRSSKPLGRPTSLRPTPTTMLLILPPPLPLATLLPSKRRNRIPETRHRRFASPPSRPHSEGSFHGSWEKGGSDG